MKERIEQQLAESLSVLHANGTVPPDVNPLISVSRTRDASHGDFATNLAMLLAKPCGRAPREIAQALIDALPACDTIRDVVIAGPGFINFFQAEDATTAVIATVLSQGDAFGRSQLGKGQRVQVEFVSANPTGPLHVGHGRGAAMGASIANLMNAVGFDVQREYYVNDAGRQMEILATSVWLRYLELAGESFEFPSNGYRGDYIVAISQSLLDSYGQRFRHPGSAVFADMAADEPAGGDKELHIDALIVRARELLGENDYSLVFDCALNSILDDIKQDLGEFGVSYDNWFSERSLAGDVQRVVDKLDATGHLYEKEGVRWFRSTAFGDDKDRAVVRANGQSTYFASDIAYIDNKLQRGFDRILYVFGADHHGYTTRMLAACEALGYPREKLEFLLIQFAILFRGGQRIQMSTRSGSFVTIRELRDEVGKDAARFFYVMRKYSQHLDFDLDLAKSQSNDNPVYYVQYAYARICSVMRQLEQRGLSFDQASGLAALERLVETAETELMTLLATYPEVIERAALAHEPHQLTGYLRDLANGLHSYYNAHKVLVDDDELRHARLCLLLAIRQVLGNGLALIDVSTPEVM
ncbi:MAG: arginine--tRNA ligase [Granulosicoccus sp.]|nr:arginine--tRNA ligase [Granulosicoccus sp.]